MTPKHFTRYATTFGDIKAPAGSPIIYAGGDCWQLMGTSLEATLPRHHILFVDKAGDGAELLWYRDRFDERAHAVSIIDLFLETERLKQDAR